MHDSRVKPPEAYTNMIHAYNTHSFVRCLLRPVGVDGRHWRLLSTSLR